MSEGDHKSGNGYDARGEDTRLERRIDEEARISQRRCGDCETGVINLQADVAGVDRHVASVNTNVNNLRASFGFRLDRMERMLELVLQAKKIPVPT